MAPKKIKIVLTLIFILLLKFEVSAQISYEEAFPNLSFNFPVEIQGSTDGTDRIFVVEQPGRIKVFPNDNTITSASVRTFLDITSIVSYASGQEIGLLGLAFHPNYTSNGFVYVYYIDRPNNYRINIARYQVATDDPNTLNPSSGLILAQFTKNQSQSNHNGGKIAFGPDGYLYISIGDGGGGGDPQKNGQNLNTVFGSILRIDVDIDGSNPIENNPDLPNGNYEIPSDNPRVGQSGLDELYAWGIRNTWKFSFDSTGNLWGADVGQNAYEEINIITKGGNYGWNKFEADTQPSYGSGTSLITSPDIKPIFYYNHSASDVSVTGGYVYKGSLTSSSLSNNYIYGDYVSGRVWSLNYNESTGSTTNELLFKTNGEFISSFGEDEAGELYFSDYGSNAKLYKLTETVTGPTTTTVNGVGEWKSLSSGTNGLVNAIVATQNNISYVGGNFTQAGDQAVGNLATLNSNDNWEVFDSNGSNGTINSIAIAPDGKIFAAGDFTAIDGINAGNIAYWNGVSWNPLGTGTNGPISKIKFNSNGDLFVGGVFTIAGGLNVNNIAMWGNDSWSALTDTSTGISGTNNEIRSIAFDENNILYVGGNFDTAGGNSASRIASWNGTTWSSLGAGTSGFVQAIEPVGDYIYAGGNFSLAGSQTVNRIARFNLNDESWEALGNGLSGNVNAMVSYDSFIYVGGSFETASDDGSVNKIVNNLARWSTTLGWEALGPNTKVGVNTLVNTLEFTKNNTELIVGGNFSAAGDLNTNNIAIWAEAFCDENSIIPEYQVNGVWQNGSNALTVQEEDDVTLSILSNKDSFTITLPDGTMVNNDYTIDNITELDSGTYSFETNQGCLENFELTVTPLLNTDDDNDGVPNEQDACPDTPLNAIVNQQGCILSTYPVDQFTISARSVTCNNLANGRIHIISKSSEAFTVNILGENYNESIDFNNELIINDLEVGAYDLCFTTIEKPEYQYCTKAIVRSPEPLEVKSILNGLENSVTLKMKGSSNYAINLNGNDIKTEQSEITLFLKQDVNFLKVSSTDTCIDAYEEVIELGNSILVYPNPAKDKVHIDVGSIEIDNVSVLLYSGEGKIVFSNTFTQPNKIITLPIDMLKSGTYFLRIEQSGSTKSFKVIKL